MVKMMAFLDPTAMHFANGGSAKLFYRGVNISSELDPQTTAINYTDHWHGEADEIDLTVQDKDGRWKGSWFPEHGDTMQLFLSDNGYDFANCGVFELDEPDAGGSRSGDTMTLRGLAAPITQALRTENSFTHEKKTLQAIVSETTGRAGLSQEGKVKSLFHKFMSQRREKDLEFLTRIAEETGHYFSARGQRAVFTEYDTIDGQAPAFYIDLIYGAKAAGSLISYSGLKFQSEGTYSKGSIEYADPDKKENVTHEETDSRIKTGDELKIRGERVETKAHAEARLKAEMHMANRRHKVGKFNLIGTMAALAGNTVGVRGFGRYDDKYVIDTSTHSQSRSGHTVSIGVSVAKQ